MHYYTCPFCGANLDPGETCDCKAEEIREGKEARTYHERSTKAHEIAEHHTEKLSRIAKFAV